MPRQARLDAPGTLHLMMIQVIEGKSIFRNSQDQEYGISLAEIARRVGVCTPAIAKAIQKMGRKFSEVQEFNYVPLHFLFDFPDVSGFSDPDG
jgi:hypothetical protein